MAAERLGAGLGIGEAFLRSVAIGQHDRAHPLFAQSIDGDRRADRRVDAAGKAEYDALETILVHIVAETEHAGAVVGFFLFRNARHRPLIAAPAIGRSPPRRYRESFLELAHLKCERLVTIEGKARAVEDQFVLTTELIGEDQRQACLDHLAQRHLMAHVDFPPVIGRAIRHEQDFGAGLSQRFADAEIVPDLLADRHADPHAAKIDRPRHLAFDENALLIELAVIGQINLVAVCEHTATVENGDRIVPPLFTLAWKPDNDPWSAIGGIGSKSLNRLQAGTEESRFEHEIFRWIAGNEQLRQEQEICPLPGGIGPCRTRLGKIAGDVADDRVELCHRYAQDVGDLLCFAHDTDLAAPQSNRNAAHCPPLPQSVPR